MPASWAEIGFSLVEHAGHAGIDHLRQHLAKPKLLTVEDLKAQGHIKTLADLPGVAALGLTAAAAGALAASPLPAGPAQPAALSYAEEFGLGDDPANTVACWPCTRRHLNTALVAAEAGLASGTAEGRKEASATITAEVLVWHRYDMTDDKRSRTDPRRLAAVEAAEPHMLAAARALPPAPGDLPLAWAAAGEAHRFLRSGSPSPLEKAEAGERLEDVQGWVGRLDTLPLPAEAAPHLTALRSARHRLNAEGNTAGAAEACMGSLRAAAVALTPDPGEEALREAHSHLKDARRAFRSGVVGAMKQERTRGPAIPRRAFLDIETRIPEVLASAYLQPSTDAPFDFGATPQTKAAFEALGRYSEARGVPVRLEPLPPEIEDGEVVGTTLGAYVPGPRWNNIWIGPQAVAEAPKDLDTLNEEVAHAGLDNDRDNIWRSGPDVPYAKMPEEREAKLASMIARLEAGIPFETDAGRPIDPRVVRLDVEALERGEDPRIVARARWEGHIQAVAMLGRVDEALALAKGGPPR